MVFTPDVVLPVVLIAMNVDLDNVACAEVVVNVTDGRTHKNDDLLKVLQVV